MREKSQGLTHEPLLSFTMCSYDFAILLFKGYKSLYSYFRSKAEPVLPEIMFQIPRELPHCYWWKANKTPHMMATGGECAKEDLLLDR